MGDAAIDAAILGLVAGIGASLRPELLKAVYWLCRKAPPRTRMRKVLIGGRGYYYGWIAIAMVVGLLIHAGSSAG